MSLAEGIITIIASIMGWFAANKLDQVIGRWVAYFTIAWENTRNEKAQKAFSDTINKIKNNSSEKYKAWEKWRNNPNG